MSLIIKAHESCVSFFCKLVHNQTRHKLIAVNAKLNRQTNITPRKGAEKSDFDTSFNCLNES